MLEGLLLLRQAARDVAERKVEAAAQVVDLRALGVERRPGEGLRLVEQGEGFRLPVEHAQARGDADLGPAALAIVGGQLEQTFERIDRLERPPDRRQQSAQLGEQVDTIRQIGGELEAALEELNGAVGVLQRLLGARRVQVRARSPRVAGALEVLGGQRRVARRVPGSGSADATAASDCSAGRRRCPPRSVRGRTGTPRSSGGSDGPRPVRRRCNRRRR